MIRPALRISASSGLPLPPARAAPCVLELLGRTAPCVLELLGRTNPRAHAGWGFGRLAGQVPQGVRGLIASEASRSPYTETSSRPGAPRSTAVLLSRRAIRLGDGCLPQAREAITVAATPLTCAADIEVPSRPVIPNFAKLP